MTPYFERNGIRLFLGDCRELLPEIAGYDLVVTDPPYVFGLASTSQEGKAGGWGDLMNNAVFYSEILRAIRPSIRNGCGAAWIFNSWRSFPVLARSSFEVGWPITSLLVWDKEWIGPGGHQGLRPSYEQVALFSSESFAITNRSLPDIWRQKWSCAERNEGHPAEKPVPLLEKLIRESSGRHVLDPFAGSSSTLVAAQHLGVQATGIEIEERYCELSARRLERESAQGELFHASTSTNGLCAYCGKPIGPDAICYRADCPAGPR